MKSKTPIISSNKKVSNDRSNSKDVLEAGQPRSIAKVTVHIVNRN